VGSNPHHPILDGNGVKAMPGSIIVPNPGLQQMKRMKIQVAKWGTPKNINKKKKFAPSSQPEVLTLCICIWAESRMWQQTLTKTLCIFKVTHGITYLPKFDHIIVIKNGTVTEQGSYQELLDRKGNCSYFFARSTKLCRHILRVRVGLGVKQILKF